MSECIICVDAGGTKTKVAGFTLTGDLIASTTVGPGTMTQKDLAIKNIEKGINQIIPLLKDQFGICFIQMGISGLGICSNIQELENHFTNLYNTKVSLVNDAEIALQSVLKEKDIPAILVLAGTGSAVYGVRNGKKVLIGGWGHLLNEKGSAYGLVQKACLLLIERFEKQVPLSDFDKKLMKELGISTVHDLRKIFYQRTKGEIAKHSKWIKSYANMNLDAFKLVEQAGLALGEQVIDAINHLGYDEKMIIGFRGGFFEDGKLIMQAFNKKIFEEPFDLKLEKNPTDPIMGAYYLAKKVLTKRGDQYET